MMGHPRFAAGQNTVGQLSFILRTPSLSVSRDSARTNVTEATEVDPRASRTVSVTGITPAVLKVCAGFSSELKVPSWKSQR